MNAEDQVATHISGNYEPNNIIMNSVESPPRDEDQATLVRDKTSKMTGKINQFNGNGHKYITS